MADNDRVVEKPEDIENFRKEKDKNSFNFEEVVFKCEMDFPLYFSKKNLDSKFEEGTSFNRTVFEKSVSFEGIQFSESAYFWGTKFLGGNTDFRGAEFLGDAFFRAAKFSGGNADFRGSEFKRGAYFRRAQFSGGDIYFSAAEFLGGVVYFSAAEFSGGDTYFLGSEFLRGAYFGGAHFSGGNAYFQGAEFSGGNAIFNNTQFSGGDAYFQGAEFSEGDAYFLTTLFSGKALFWETKFNRKVSFKGTIFENISQLRGANINNGDRETYRIIKNELLKVNNRIEALEYHKKEMKEYWKELCREEKWYKKINEKFILFFNLISTYYGARWIQGVGFTMLIAFIFFWAFLGLSNNPDWSFEAYFRYLNPAHSYKFLQNFCPPDFAYIIDAFGRALIGYGYYQTIQAFRKYKRI